MEVIAIVVGGVIAVAVLVMLFGPKPRHEVVEAEPEDQTDGSVVDVFPPSGGGH